MSTTESATDRTSVTVENHIATVTMTRGDKHNALDGHMFLALKASIDEVKADPSVRVVVLHGDGPSFCSGIDVGSLAGGGVLTFEELVGRTPGVETNLAQYVAAGWAEVPAPVIAAIHGNAFGGGIQIALGADVRIAAPDAKLSIMESKWGLIPDMGASRVLPRIMPIDRAKELVFSGRILSGTEAREVNLVTEVADDPLARAYELANEWLKRSPDALKLGKQLLDETWSATRMEAFELEAALQTKLMGSPNQIESVRAGMAKEPPNFT